MSRKQLLLTFGATMSSICAVAVLVFLMFAALDAFTAPTFSLYKSEWTCMREANQQGPGVNKPYRYKECVLWKKK